LPYAIYPNPEWKCYSGATLVEDDRVIAMYHGKSLGNMLAISDDPLLLNWDKLTGTAVIPMPKKEEKSSTRKQAMVLTLNVKYEKQYHY